jgi:hypothetical protein
MQGFRIAYSRKEYGVRSYGIIETLALRTPNHDFSAYGGIINVQSKCQEMIIVRLGHRTVFPFPPMFHWAIPGNAYLRCSCSYMSAIRRATLFNLGLNIDAERNLNLQIRYPTGRLRRVPHEHADRTHISNRTCLSAEV